MAKKEKNSKKAVIDHNWVAILIAVLALGSAIWSAYEDRKHNRISMRPILLATYSLNKSDVMFDFVGISIENRGLGPAVLYPLHIYYKGKFIGTTLPEDHDKLVKELKFGYKTTMFKVHGTHVLKTGEIRKFFWVDDPEINEKDTNMLIDIMKNLIVLVPYKSLYNETFILPIGGGGSRSFDILPKGIIEDLLDHHKNQSLILGIQ